MEIPNDIIYVGEPDAVCKLVEKLAMIESEVDAIQKTGQVNSEKVGKYNHYEWAFITKEIQPYLLKHKIKMINSVSRVMPQERSVMMETIHHFFDYENNARVVIRGAGEGLNMGS